MTITAAAEVRAALAGAWRLLSLRNIRPDGSVDYPLGPDAIGQLVYTESGRMSAQLMRPGQPRFRADNARQAGDAEVVAAYTITPATTAASGSTPRPAPSSTKSKAARSPT